MMGMKMKKNGKKMAEANYINHVIDNCIANKIYIFLINAHLISIGISFEIG